MHNQIVQVEEESWSNKQYSRRECLEIVGISETVINRFLEESALNIFEELDVSIAPSEIETCHRVGPLSHKNVIMKIFRKKDAGRMRDLKKNMKI